MVGVKVSYCDVSLSGIETSGLQAFHEANDKIFQPIPVAHEYYFVLSGVEVLDRVDYLLTAFLNEVGGGFFLVDGSGLFLGFVVEFAASGVAGWGLMGFGGCVLWNVDHHEPNNVDLVLYNVTDGVKYILDWGISAKEYFGRIAAERASEGLDLWR